MQVERRDDLFHRCESSGVEMDRDWTILRRELNLVVDVFHDSLQRFGDGFCFVLVRLRVAGRARGDCSLRSRPKPGLPREDR